MKTEIISIGSELTSGQNLDTNSQWLSQRLAEIGIAVRWHTTLADDLDENVAAFGWLPSGAQMVLITGGTWPTQDDLTRGNGPARGVELVFHEESFARIQDMFSLAGDDARTQTACRHIPAGGRPIANSCGTARASGCGTATAFWPHAGRAK